MKDQFIAIIEASKHKILIPKFDSDYRYELLRYEKFYSIYQHAKGSYWNIGGRHYHYIHDLDGKFTGSVNSITGRPLEKVRLLKADIVKMIKIAHSKIIV